MISSLTGEIQHLGLNDAVIDVNGVGYQFSATPQTLSTLAPGKKVTVQTLLQVRDDVPVLYGFAHAQEREIFEIMMSVSGIGPRIALAVISMYEPQEVRLAVDQQDDKAFSKVPGIGPKTARRIILELSGKLVPLEADPTPETTTQATHQPTWHDQLLQALLGLGWAEKDALKAIESTVEEQPELTETTNVSEVLRATLRHLGQHQTRRGR